MCLFNMWKDCNVDFDEKMKKEIGLRRMINKMNENYDRWHKLMVKSIILNIKKFLFFRLFVI